MAVDTGPSADSGAQDLDADGYPTPEDCNDADPLVYPGATEVCDETDNDCDNQVDEDAADAIIWWRDADGDGFGVASSLLSACTQPSGTCAPGEEDCDDTRSQVHPGVDEVCDGADNDCDGRKDEPDAVDAPTWYADTDGDGYGNAISIIRACDAPASYVLDASDCDDDLPDVNPGSAEFCDGIDDDCDGSIDEDDATDASTWYADRDGDGYGNSSDPVQACAPPSGYVTEGSDCNDGSADIHPGAPEWCDDVDEDCDGIVDAPDPIDGLTWYPDGDGDGFGDTELGVVSCHAPSGTVSLGGDCDDASSPVHPDAAETCNGLDDDCDGSIDEDATDTLTWVRDADGDGWADPLVTTEGCVVPSGYLTPSDGAIDCDDSLATVYPGAPETCDALDDDCDGLVDDADPDAVDRPPWYADEDGDGYGLPGGSVYSCTPPPGTVESPTDCDDSSATAHPGGEETCDGLDNDCDGTTDEADAVDAPTWYVDADGDGHGSYASTVVRCDAPAGFVASAMDCDDTDPLLSPSTPELCNGVDDDCDGEVDEGSIPTWYPDEDGDGYGDPTSPVSGCSRPTGYVSDGSDCDDTDPTVSPATRWYQDADGDGFGNAGVSLARCLAPAGYVSNATDCNDTSAAASPGGVERCDDLDNDCDGTTDESSAIDASTWYGDGDGDGYGLVTRTLVACDEPDGYVAVGTDCDDTSKTVYPSATETCNSVDDDCDGVLDDGVTPTWYRDADGDDYGVATSTRAACTRPSGYAPTSTDCNDSSASVYPGATETCNSVDDDCDGSVDEGVTPKWYRDADTDGYGSSTTTTSSCSCPTGYVSSATDCDDTNDAIHPGAREICWDSTDNDCNGTTDACKSAVDVAPYAKVTGKSTDDEAGFVVAYAGDLDGDGYDDLVTGAPNEDVGGGQSGSAYLMRGPITATVGVASCSGEIYGSGTNDYLGFGVSGSGDTNADGYDDFLVGALDGWFYEGEAYLQTGPFSGIISASSATAIFEGTDQYAYAGSTLAEAGDFDGDGNDDILIGAQDDDDGSVRSVGCAYLFLGPQSGTKSIETYSLKLLGESESDQAGLSLDGASDYNGDGLADLLVGAPGDDDGGTDAGAAYLVLAPVTGRIYLSAADAKWTGPSAGSSTGTETTFVGDQDGDGMEDLLIGSPNDDSGGTDSGSAFIVHGGVTGTYSLTSADVKLIGESAGDTAGTWTAGGGDLNADGAMDIALSAPGNDSGGSDAGVAYVLFGPVTAASIDLSSADARFVGEDASDALGSLAIDGDLNADGFSDLIVGAPGDDVGGGDAGAAYVIPGGW